MAILLEDIIRSLELWLKLSKKPQGEPNVNPNLDPVLLIPGIAGSMLHAVDDRDGSEERVWVRFLAAEYKLKTKLWSRYDPSTGRTESLDENTTITVPEDRHGLYAIDVLDPDLIVGSESVYYFHDMIVEMLKWGYQEGITLFGFGYDFRQSNRLQETMDKLAEKLESVYNAAGGKKINVITHSMGGLLVKCFMSLRSEIFEKYVKNWIAIAAPFQGAPGCIYSSFLNGMSFVEGWEQRLYISKWSMHQLVQISYFCLWNCVLGSLIVQHLLWKLLGFTVPLPFSTSLLLITFALLYTEAEYLCFLTLSKFIILTVSAIYTDISVLAAGCNLE